MTGSEWLMLGAGVALLLVSGVWHLGGILAIKACKPASGEHPYLAVLVTFWGLALLHLSEIALAAGGYWLALSLPDTGAITHESGTRMAGLLYFSGVSFATMGYTAQDATGAIRLLVMLQGLGGFMLITWSATFVYSVWDERFGHSGN